MITPLFRGQSAFYKSLFAIAAPIMLHNFISSLVAMLSTILIGRMGTVEIAAVGLGNQVFAIYNMTLFGICSGGAIFTAQFWGKRDIPGIRKNMGLCLCFGLGAGVLFTLGASLAPDFLISIYSRDPLVIEAGAQYLKHLSMGFMPFAVSMVFTFTLRSVEKVKLAVTGAIISLSLNTLLNFLLIHGAGPVPAMGVRGAAIATAIARYTEMIILVTGCYIMRYAPAGRLKELFAFNTKYVARYLKIALPVVINESVWALGVTVQNLIFARSGTDAIAAFNITGTISQLVWVVIIGMGNGIAVLIGKKIGEGNELEAREYASRITRFGPLLSIVLACILIPLSRVMLNILNVSPDVMRTVSLMIIFICFVYPLKAFSLNMIVGVCRAGGDTVFCILYDIAPMWLVSLPLAAAAAFILRAPAHLIYLALIIEDPIKMALGVWRLKSGKWLNNVVN